MAGRLMITRAVVALLVIIAVVVNAVSDNDALAWTCYLGVMVGAAVGAGIGASRAPRERRRVPALIALGVGLTALGDVVWSVLEVMGADTDVSVADLAWLASYVVLCAALWSVLARDGARGRVDVDLVIDAVTIVAVAVVIFWSISIDAVVADDTATPFAQAVWMAYPIADAILLALVVRVMMSRSSRDVLGGSFAIGVGLWLATDLAYLHWSGSRDLFLSAMDAGWMIGLVLMSRAAWRSNKEPSAAPGSPTLGSVAQILVAVGPLLVPPALELLSDLRDEPDEPLQLFLGTTVLVTLAFVRTGRLIRDKERVHRELESAHEAALEASHAKSMFLANMSHEIRTPLTTVLAAGEMLEDTSLDDVQTTLVARMQRSGQLLRTLVEGVLDFSRIEAGQLTMSSRTFDLHALAADAVDAARSRGTGSGVGVECRLAPRLPQMVVGDPGRLLQILNNLLENALKFTIEGQVMLVVRPAVEVVATPGEWVELIVSDTGIGIGSEDQEAVFESFRQVDGSMTRRFGGNGLGLAICRELAELMGGSITLQSRPGVGSTFTVRLPLAGASHDAHPVPAPAVRS